MIVVRETSGGAFERISGNPTLTSLDGQVRAPLRTILHDSWTAEDRSKFGVYVAEPFVEPAGKVAVGQPRYERQAGKVIELRDLQDAPAPRPDPLDEVRAELTALAARVAALEAKS